MEIYITHLYHAKAEVSFVVVKFGYLLGGLDQFSWCKRD